MSLRVWLPLISDNHNQGLLDIMPTNLGTVSFIDGGKLGKCLSAGTGTQTTNGISYPTNLVSELGTQFSCAIWVKPLGNHVHYNGTFVSSGNWNAKCWSFGVNQNNTKVDIFSKGYNRYLNCEVPVNTWTHLCCTSDNGTVKLYKNGVYVGQTTGLPESLDSDASNFCVGRETYASGYFSFNGNINDLRIYDHVLSPKEVKLLSQGLVCHYKLDNPYSTSNLFPNGNGIDGALGWSNNNISTTEIPSGQSNIKASYYSNNTMTSFIPFSHETTYTISVWLKGTQATGTCYPSLLTYDADKKFIGYENAMGFSNTYKTTLAQPLKKGDTVVYATDLSAWTAEDNYWNYCAIFGYKDSFGTLYPDMAYTADSPTFAAKGSTKTHIDKTNNTITLNAPFVGEDRPAGTTICQATTGGTYYYPFGGISVSTIQDWTQKTATLNPNANNRLKYAKYFNYLAYPLAYHAGITLIDNNSNDKVYDSSGYNYHGKSIATSLLISSDTPRNQFSTNFNGTDDGIIIENLPLSNIINTAITYSFWIKPNGESGARSVYFGSYSYNSWSIEKKTNDVLRLYWNGSPDETCTGANITDGVWQHICITKEGTNDVKVYINGSLKWTSTAAHNAITFPTTYRIGRDSRSGNGTPYKGQISDFRIYATALSADDILTLYNNPITLSKTGTMFIQGGFMEVTS